MRLAQNWWTATDWKYGLNCSLPTEINPKTVSDNLDMTGLYRSTQIGQSVMDASNRHSLLYAIAANSNYVELQ